MGEENIKVAITGGRPSGMLFYANGQPIGPIEDIQTTTLEPRAVTNHDFSVSTLLKEMTSPLPSHSRQGFRTSAESGSFRTSNEPVARKNRLSGSHGKFRKAVGSPMAMQTSLQGLWGGGMSGDEFYRYSERVVYGYQSAGWLKRLVCEFWYLIYRRWGWIFHGKGETDEH